MSTIFYRIKKYHKERAINLKAHFKSRTYRESLIRNKNCSSLIFMGLPRSGTSLVYDILNTHRKIYISYELSFMPLLYLSKEQQFPLYHEMIRQSYMLYNNQFFHRNHLSLELPFKLKYAYFADKMIYKPANNFQARLKNALKRKFIDKLICIVRDPCERYVSYKSWLERRKIELPLTEIGTEPNNFETELSKWNSFISCVFALQRQFYDRVLILSYELLLDHPEETLQKLDKFLDLEPFDIDLDKLHNKSKINIPNLFQIPTRSLFENTKKNYETLNSYFNKEVYHFNFDHCRID